jgi:hypothetical protein
MAFESKRLRVQLPCRKAGTLVEREPDPAAAQIPNPECTINASCNFNSPIACPGFPSLQNCDFCSFDTPGCYFDTPGCYGFRTPYCRFYDSPICNPYQTGVGCGLTDPCRLHATFDCGGTRNCVIATRSCGGPTRIDPTDELIVIDPDPKDPETVLLKPEDLGRFRRQLQAELEQIEALEQRKGEVEGQLKELDSAEKALKKRSKGK